MNPTYDASGSPYAANWNPQAYWGMGNVWGGQQGPQGGQGGTGGNSMLQAIMSLLSGRGMSSFGGGMDMGGLGGMFGGQQGGNPMFQGGGMLGAPTMTGAPTMGASTPFASPNTSSIAGSGGGLGQAYSNNFGSTPMHPVMLFGGMPGSTNQGGMLSGMR